MSFTDTLSVEHIADPTQALKDVRYSHAWATRELENAAGARRFVLERERERLAGIGWKLKRMGA